MEDEQKRRVPEPPQPPRDENETEKPELATGGTGTRPQEGVPNPGFTSRGG